MILIMRIFPLATLFVINFFVLSIKESERNFDSLQWNQHQQEIHKLRQYQIHGSFAYISNQQKIYTRFFLQKINRDHYQLFLIDMLGRSLLKIRVQFGKIQLINSKGECCLSIKEAKKMISKFTNEIIPVNNLIYWIIGLPGKATNYKVSNQYRLSEIYYIQKDKIWKVIYRKYDNKIQPALPLNIEIIEGDHCIKLNMYKWIVVK